MTKNKGLEWERYITGILDVTAMLGCLMEIDASIEPFGFSVAVLGSTRRPTTVNKFYLTALKRIMTPSFVTLDMFALVVPYFFAV